MQHGPLNFHKIMFLLEVLETNEEKIAYLKQMKKEVARVIDCFSAPKIVSLREYADPLKNLPDNCPEFQEFISLMIDKHSIDRNDSRVPSNRQLKALADRELSEYMKMLTVIDDSLKTFEKAQTTSENEREELTEKNILPTDNPPDYFERSAVNLDAAFNAIAQTEELKENVAVDDGLLVKSDRQKNKNDAEIKIVWHGSSTSLMKLFELLSKDGLLNKNINGEVKDFVKKYLVNPDGKEIAIN
ncbi:MAG: hypothetical protein GXO87_10040 [Chlorobi bacterium]|nr:hypothetical protein [Chlorobiota bacterium]